ncbi:MAG: type II toxin-antitoxin system VapC family toxin [Pirellulales bacterium]|nr:type II toxin-antitoxin system VapC family toxin [Pirellulales bacterium]
MHLLLDTHAWLWFVKGDPQLSVVAREAIEDADRQKYVSVVSIWEVSIKTAIGKMTWHEPLEEFVARELQPFRRLPISVRHAVATSQLPLHHRDPFDRMLAVQTLQRGLTIVSRDSVFDAYGIPRIWDRPDVIEG